MVNNGSPGDIIYVFGGTSSNGFNVSVEWYEPRVNKWTFLDPRPNLSSTCMCIGNVGGMVWIAGEDTSKSLSLKSIFHF